MVEEGFDPKKVTQGEIQSEKQQSILPCVISDNAAAFLSVLHFLKPHRVNVERKRQDAHSIYMRPGRGGLGCASQMKGQ